MEKTERQILTEKKQKAISKRREDLYFGGKKVS